MFFERNGCDICMELENYIMDLVFNVIARHSDLLIIMLPNRHEIATILTQHVTNMRMGFTYHSHRLQLISTKSQMHELLSIIFNLSFRWFP